MIRHEIHLENPHSRTINRAVETLKNGGIIIYPTDTVYGIGCSLFKKNAIEKLYKIKGKSKFEPMSMICSSIQQASEYVSIDNFTFRILKKCFPGPFTIILKAKHQISKLMLSRQKEIGIRIPDSLVCKMLVEELGHPILNTSMTDPEDDFIYYPDWDSRDQYSDAAELMLDAGSFSEAFESTVLRIMDSEIEILRQGKGDVKKIDLIPG
jgi:tRNA threonylcarbamoyl adenosine modification protein (Sua5/YciO/YrdC/YwlC family)